MDPGKGKVINLPHDVCPGCGSSIYCYGRFIGGREGRHGLIGLQECERCGERYLRYWPGCYADLKGKGSLFPRAPASGGLQY